MTPSKKPQQQHSWRNALSFEGGPLANGPLPGRLISHSCRDTRTLGADYLPKHHGKPLWKTADAIRLLVTGLPLLGSAAIPPIRSCTSQALGKGALVVSRPETRSARKSC